MAGRTHLRLEENNQTIFEKIFPRKYWKIISILILVCLIFVLTGILLDFIISEANRSPFQKTIDNEIENFEKTNLKNENYYNYGQTAINEFLEKFQIFQPLNKSRTKRGVLLRTAQHLLDPLKPKKIITTEIKMLNQKPAIFKTFIYKRFKRNLNNQRFDEKLTDDIANVFNARKKREDELKFLQSELIRCKKSPEFKNCDDIEKQLEQISSKLNDIKSDMKSITDIFHNKKFMKKFNKKPKKDSSSEEKNMEQGNLSSTTENLNGYEEKNLDTSTTKIRTSTEGHHSSYTNVDVLTTISSTTITTTIGPTKIEDYTKKNQENNQSMTTVSPETSIPPQQYTNNTKHQYGTIAISENNSNGTTPSNSTLNSTIPNYETNHHDKLDKQSSPISEQILEPTTLIPALFNETQINSNTDDAVNVIPFKEQNNEEHKIETKDKIGWKSTTEINELVKDNNSSVPTESGTTDKIQLETTSSTSSTSFIDIKDTDENSSNLRENVHQYDKIIIDVTKATSSTELPLSEIKQNNTLNVKENSHDNNNEKYNIDMKTVTTTTHLPPAEIKYEMAIKNQSILDEHFHSNGSAKYENPLAIITTTVPGTKVTEKIETTTYHIPENKGKLVNETGESISLQRNDTTQNIDQMITLKPYILTTSKPNIEMDKSDSLPIQNINSKEIPLNATITSTTKTSSVIFPSHNTEKSITPMQQNLDNKLHYIQLTTSSSLINTSTVNDTTATTVRTSIETTHIPHNRSTIITPKSIDINSLENEVDDSNKEHNKKLQNNLNLLSEIGFKTHPRFHEELSDDDDMISDKGKWHPEKFSSSNPLYIQWKEKIPKPIDNSELIDNIEVKEGGRQQDSNKITSHVNETKKKSDITSASGPFLSLCQQLYKDGRIDLKNLPTGPPQDGFTTAPIHHFTGRGQNSFPVTGESMKSSAQVVFNPNFGMMSYPVCFGMIPPNMRSGHNQQIWMPQMMNTMNGFGQGGVFYAPIVGGGTTGTGSSIINHMSQQTNRNLLQQSSQPYFCTYMPANTGIQSGFGGATFRSDKQNDDNNEDDDVEFNIPSDTDIIYASYANQRAFAGNNSIGGHLKSCPPGTLACFGTNQCISKSKWCDSTVDCMDASDETACSCKSRLSKSKICDGYHDCPMGEDEIGCFGCPKFSFSCYNNNDEYVNAQKSIISMCYNALEKCDGFKNCLNGNDEKDCNMIVRTLGLHLSYATPYTNGILHRNYKGKWYPVCDKAKKWAKEACANEIDYLESDPVIKITPGFIPGPFIQPKSDNLTDFGMPMLTDECTRTENNHKSNVLIHVKCPEMKCGLVKKIDPPKTTLRIRRSLSAQNVSMDREKRNDERVVGGRQCDPMEWPFIVGLYKDGRFHCGGIIYNEHWIITAAHCVVKYEFHYYEVRVGMLRRYSYSPMTQNLKVSHIVPHEGYSRKDMINDFAMIRTEEPILYNRWIRPICMPDQGRSATSNDDQWIWGPAEGTICTAVGWGSVHEKGTGPDHLRDVQIPIIKLCKHSADRKGEEICAGEPDGGRDACQGDSGGPLFCRSLQNPKEWYLAGVVSHGEGCARPDEPGVYTRVAIFIDWITATVNNTNLPKTRPQQICPGYICIWGGEQCISKIKRCNNIIDCLGGEDEVGCPFDHSPNVGSNRNLTNEENDENLQEFVGLTTPLTPQHFRNDKIEDSTKPPLKTFDFTTSEDIKKEPLTTEKQKLTTDKSIIHPISDGIKEKLTTIKPIVNHFEHPVPHEHPSSSSLDPNNHHKRENLTETIKEKPTKPTNIKVGPNKFLCKRITQTIDISHRCDRIIDCEDGSDEEDCACRDYLKGTLKNLICDGKADCKDLSDEKNCGNCTSEQFLCPLTQSCIEKSKVCNNHMDCLFNEDELDCFALTNGKKIFLDVHHRPTLQSLGVFSRNEKGKWRVVCSDEIDFHKEGSKMALKICVLLGFTDYIFFNTTTIPSPNLEILNIDEHGINPRKRHFINKHLINRYDLNEDDDSEHLNNDQIIQLRNSNIFPNPEMIVDNEEIVSTPKCIGLYIECRPHSNIFHKPSTSKPPIKKEEKTIHVPTAILPIIQPEKKPHVIVVNKNKTDIHHDDDKHKLKPTKQEIHHFPWSVRIYANGNYKCNGVLLDRYWILASSECFAQFDLKYDYVAGLFGESYSYHSVKGPDEQIQRIDCIRNVQQSNIGLLHLDYPVRYSRHVLPTYLPEISNYNKTFANNKSECLILYHDNSHGFKTLPIHQIFPNEHKYHECKDKHLCFERIKDKTNKKEHCDSKDSIHHGLIVCREETDIWYPKAFSSYKNIECDFEKLIIVQALGKYYKDIQKIIDHQECEPKQSIHSIPICSTFRCALGNCLPDEKVCNGNVDCHDSSDENPKLCHKDRKDCLPSEMKCRNGRCISKTKFCDHINDCGDLTDEPIECSCYTYLKTIEPQKICDGIRNCWDKSDENPYNCNCTADAFRCGSSDLCVPKDYVCDRENDCPKGEDERYCYGIERPSVEGNTKSDGFGQVIEQSYGIWHTKCFPRSKPPNETEIIQICQKLGYDDDNLKPDYRLIDDFEDNLQFRNSNQTNSEILDNTRNIESKYRDSTKAIVINKFSPLRLNSDLTLFIKPSRPIAEIVKWDSTDSRKCYRLEIKCEN